MIVTLYSSALMNLIRLISWLLGVSMFVFGVLKLFPPFKDWYTVQITASGLSPVSYALGIVGEVLTGFAFLFVLIKKVSPQLYFRTLLVASFVIIIIMATGVYVHLHPAVPAEVLPLKIKPPYIPGFFILLAFINMWQIFSHIKSAVKNI